MDEVLEADRCHGGESGNGRGRRLPNAARLNGIVPMPIVNDAPSTLTGLLEILAKSFVEDSGSRAQVRNSCMIGSKERKSESKNCWEIL